MTQTSVEDDRELLTRAQAGDMSAFESLVGKHEDKVYGLALRMTRSEADAADIALMRLRRQKVVDSVSDELAGPEFTERGSLADGPESDWSKRADDKVLEDELGRAIQAATDALPEGYREVFLLKDVEGLSYEEISEMVGISIPAVKSRLHRARLALREAIDAFYKEV